MSRRSDASTSTDDIIKGRPLCLFYFTHPFGVLSPEPPTITAAPAHISRAFINMEPVSPCHFWGSPTTTTTEDSYNTATTTSVPESKVSYDLGKATVHKSPVNLVSLARTRQCTLDFCSRRDSLSSSLFSSDIWFNSSSSARSVDVSKRVLPYNRILPPLRLPTPRDLCFDSSDDVWPKKCLNPEKFSLPPIEMPKSKVCAVKEEDSVIVEELSSVEGVECRVREARGRRRRVGVSKHKRRGRLSGVQRMVTCLMRRALTAVLIISLLGLLWAGVYLFGFTRTGSEVTAELGVPASVNKGLRYVHGVFGVLLCAVHLLLLVGGLTRSDVFCEVYVWFMLVYCAALLLTAVTVTIAAVLDNRILFACLYLLAIVFCVLVSFYSTMVVANYRMTLP